MNKKIYLVLVALLIFVSTVSAGTITGASVFVNEQCETNKEFYSICAEYDGTYFVNITGSGSQWVSYAPETFSLSAGQCKELVVFVTPECYANSGNYAFEINVLGAEEFSKEITLIVTQAHNQTLEVFPLANTSRACETNEYFVTVTNTSRYVGEFILNTNNITSSWVDLYGKPFVLNPYESRDFILKITPNCSTTPTIVNFDLKLSNTLTNAVSTAYLTQNIVGFVPFTINNLPLGTNTIDPCSETGETIDFSITNNSPYYDEYTVTFVGPNFAKINKSKIALDSNESETITLTIDKADVNSHYFGINVYSQKYRRTFNVEGIINMLDCHNILLEKISNETSFCVGPFEQQFKIKNNGFYDTNVEITSKHMNGVFSVSVSPNQEKTIVLYMDATKLETNNILVEASSKYANSIVDYNLEVFDCVSYDVNMISKIETECNSGELFPIEIKNRSIFEMTVDLNALGVDFIEFSDKNITLAPSESGLLYAYVPPSCGKEAGTYYTTIIFDNNKGLVKERPIELVLLEGCIPTDDSSNGILMVREAFFDLNFFNDSNLSTEITNIIIEGFDYKSNFEPMTLQPFEERIISFELILPEGFEEKVVDINMVVSTSLGDKNFSKQVLVTERPAVISGLFALTDGIGLISIIILLLLVILIIYAVAPKNKKTSAESKSPSQKPYFKESDKKEKPKTSDKKTNAKSIKNKGKIKTKK